MPDLSSLSNEELLSQLQGIRGGQQPPQSSTHPTTQVSQSGFDPSQMSDEELLASAKILKQTIPSIYLESKVNTVNSQSPLSFGDRLAFAYADDSNKYDMLRSKFQFVEKMPDGKYVVGNDIGSLNEVDPGGLFNDALGDLADLAPLIAPIAGQISGAVLGTMASPGAGTILGGAAGSGLGEVANKVIASSLGVGQRNPADIAGDIAISTAFGALGEGIGLALKSPAATGVAKNGFKAVQGILQRNPAKKEVVEDIISKTAKFASNVNPEATKAVFKYKPENVFNGFFENPDSVTQIAKETVDDIVTHRKVLGEQLGASVKAFGRSLDEPIVKVGPEVHQFLNGLVSRDVLTPDFKINTSFITDGSDLSIFRKIMKTLDVKPSSSGASITFKNSLSPREAISLKRQLASRFEGLSRSGARDVTVFNKAISDQLEKSAQGLGTKGADFLAANKKFSEFAGMMEELSSAGFNLDRPVSVASFIDNYFQKSPVLKDAFKRVDLQTPLPLLERIEKFAAAQEFRSASPNILRFGFVAGLLGLARADTPEEKVGSLALAFLAGSPAGNRLLLKAGSKVGRGVASLAQAIPKTRSSITTGQQSFIRALISQAARVVLTKQDTLNQPQGQLQSQPTANPFHSKSNP